MTITHLMVWYFCAEAQMQIDLEDLELLGTVAVDQPEPETPILTLPLQE